MNTQQAIAFFTNKANTLTQSLTALGLGNNGETVTSLQTKVDQAVKTAFGKREQLSSKLDMVAAKARQAEDKLSLAVGNQAIEQERLAELQKQQRELEIAIQSLQDRKQVLSANGDSKKAAIKAEIATIKANITKTEADVAAVKKQIADGLALVANYDSLRQQAQTAQEQANYHSQYVQYWGKVGEEKKRSGGHNDIYGWITNTAEVNARDSYQAQANQFTQQAVAIQGQVDSFKQSLPVLEGTKNSKTDQIWLYYQELDAKNNVLSFASTQSGNDLALLDLQLSQSQTDLTQLKNTDIPSQKTITDGTTQRVTQVQSELDQLKTQKISAQKSLDSFNQSNKELLTTDLSLDLLQDSITKSQANIASLQGKLAKPNQSASVINSLNLSLTNEQAKLGQLKQQYQLEALEVLAVNQDRLESLKGQLAAEGSVGGAVKETTIGGYLVLVSQFAEQLTGLSDIWAESLKENHQFKVEVSNLFDSNLTAFVGVKKFIEDNLATPYSDYVLNGIQLDEALAIQDTQVKYRDVLAKTVDDLQENIELQKKSVEQTDLLSVQLTHIVQLRSLETQFANLQNDYRLFDQKQLNLQNDYNSKVGVRQQKEQQLGQAQNVKNIIDTARANNKINAQDEFTTWNLAEAQTFANSIGSVVVENPWPFLSKVTTATVFIPVSYRYKVGVNSQAVNQRIFDAQAELSVATNNESTALQTLQALPSEKTLLDTKLNQLSPLLINELTKEVANEIQDLPNQIDLPNDQKEQLIETSLQKYIEQKKDTIFPQQAQEGWTSQDKYPRYLADINGDGKADIVGFGYDTVALRFSVWKVMLGIEAS